MRAKNKALVQMDSTTDMVLRTGAARVRYPVEEGLLYTTALRQLGVHRTTPRMRAETKAFAFVDVSSDAVCRVGRVRAVDAMLLRTRVAYQFERLLSERT